MTTPVARIVMMQRDEGEMLFRWLLHYTAIFGATNITIMDNGSKDPFTLRLLQAAETSGVTIMRGFDRPHDFLFKGGHFKNIIEHWDAEYPYDFAIPVDCDEIIAVFRDDRISIDRDDILAELASLTRVRCALRMDMSLFNVPGSRGWFSPDRDFPKGFLPARSIGDMDNGHHAPVSRLEEGYRDTRLTYLHYHNRPFEDFQRTSRRKLRYRVKAPFTRASLEEYRSRPDAPGRHLVRNLLMSEEEYANLYANCLRVSVPELAKAGASRTFLSVGGADVEWSPMRYLKTNPDVRDYANGPLHHYIRCGWIEGRHSAGSDRLIEA